MAATGTTCKLNLRWAKLTPKLILKGPIFVLFWCSIYPNLNPNLISMCSRRHVRSFYCKKVLYYIANEKVIIFAGKINIGFHYPVESFSQMILLYLGHVIENFLSTFNFCLLLFKLSEPSEITMKGEKPRINKFWFWPVINTISCYCFFCY